MNHEPAHRDASMKRENVQAIYPLLHGQEAFLIAHHYSTIDPGALQTSSRTMNAFFAYQPRSLNKTVLLNRSSDCESREKTTCHLEWKDDTAGGFEVRIVEAGHETILLEPEVERVAEVNRRAVNGSQ